MSGAPSAAPGTSREQPLVRPSARVILLDPADRILLFRVTEPGNPTARAFWITPGGGVEGDETYAQCAIREVLEETGIDDVELGPCVWLREHTWPWGDAWIHSIERFYVGRTSQSIVSNDPQLEHELQFLAEHRWWSLTDLGASPERLVPRDFAALVEPLVAGQWPASPIAVGR